MELGASGGRLSGRLLPVDIAPVTDLHDGHDPGRVVHLVQDSENALADPIPIAPGELLAPWGPAILGQSLDASHDSAAISDLQGLQLFHGRWLDPQLIVRHAASYP